MKILIRILLPVVLAGPAAAQVVPMTVPGPIYNIPRIYMPGPAQPIMPAPWILPMRPMPGVVPVMPIMPSPWIAPIKPTPEVMPGAGDARIAPIRYALQRAQPAQPAKDPVAARAKLESLFDGRQHIPERDLEIEIGAY